MSSTSRPLDPSHRRKRVRFATSSQASSEPSLSDESALASTGIASDTTAASDYGSDSDSSLSDSSEDPSSESSSDDDEDMASDDNLEEHAGRNGITSLRAGQGKKPTMKLDQDDLGPDIRVFLKDFLPQLKAANEELEAQRRDGTLKGREIDATEGEEGAPYIEMDLGLGVLEERDPNADGSESESGSDEDMEGGLDEKERDVLGKLMGRGMNEREKVVVQEVQDGRGS